MANSLFIFLSFFFQLQAHFGCQHAYTNVHALIIHIHRHFIYFLFMSSWKGQRSLLWLVNCVEFVSWSGNFFICDHVWSCGVKSCCFLIDCKHLSGNCLFHKRLKVLSLSRSHNLPSFQLQSYLRSHSPKFGGFDTASAHINKNKKQKWQWLTRLKKSFKKSQSMASGLSKFMLLLMIFSSTVWPNKARLPVSKCILEPVARTA